MLLRRETLDGIAAGRIHLQFRRQRRPTVYDVADFDRRLARLPRAHDIWR